MSQFFQDIETAAAAELETQKEQLVKSIAERTLAEQESEIFRLQEDLTAKREALALAKADFDERYAQPEPSEQPVG